MLPEQGHGLQPDNIQLVNPLKTSPLIEHQQLIFILWEDCLKAVSIQ